MKRSLHPALLAGALLLSSAAVFPHASAEPAVSAPVADKDLGFLCRTDKTPVLYRTGEPMRFTFELVDRNTMKPVPGRRVRYARSGDDGKSESGFFVSGKPFVYTTRIDCPGFVRIQLFAQDAQGRDVTAGGTIFDGGAGADVNRIPFRPEPQDFRAFWDGWMKKLRDTPYRVKQEKIPHENCPQAAAFRYSVTTFEGERPATGYVVHREDAAPGSLPLLVRFSGYGFGRTDLNACFPQAMQGFLVLEVTRHGEDPDRNDPAYYTELQNGSMRNFCFRNNGNPAKSDFLAMILRAQRAMQYATSLPCWDRKRIIVEGGSMGAYQAIAAAALNPQVTQCNVSVPWCADLAGHAEYRRIPGWRPEWTEALGYFDLIHLATLVRCPVRMTVGLGDYICPPSGEMLLFRRLGGPKTIEICQNFGHGCFSGPRLESFTFREELR